MFSFLFTQKKIEKGIFSRQSFKKISQTLIFSNRKGVLKVFDQNRKNAVVRNQRTKLQLTFLYYGRTVRSSHRRFSIGVSLFPVNIAKFLRLPISKTLEAAVLRCSSKQVFLKLSQNSKENAQARASFLIKLQASGIL